MNDAQRIKDINEFYRKYVTPCYSKYLDYDFRKLIVDYQIIELEIAKNVVDIVSFYFRAEKYSFNGQRFFSRNSSQNFAFISEFVASDRNFRLGFRDDGFASQQRTYEIKVEHFGAIRIIVIEFPEYLFPHVAKLADLLNKYILAAYTSLENAFISKCVHLADGICKKINTILTNHLMSVGKKHLMEPTRFFVFQKDAGFFYFDKESYTKTIEYLRKNQSDLFSAYELIVWLLTNPVPFAKSLSSKSFLAKGKYMSQEWEKAAFRDEKKFFEAARKLYDCKPYAVVAFCRSKNDEFSLSVVFLRSHKHEIVPELKKVRDLIKEEFEKEVAKYSSFLNVNKINLIRLEQTIGPNLNIYGEFVGYALAGFFKGINHLH